MHRALLGLVATDWLVVSISQSQSSTTLVPTTRGFIDKFKAKLKREY